MPGGRRPNASIVSAAASRVHAINLFGDWDYHGGECPSTRSNVRDRELKVHEGGIRVREGGGCLLVIGLPFIALGLVFFAGGTGLVPFDNADEVPLWALVVTAVMGAIAILTGVVLVFERRVVEIDTRLGQVRRERHLFFPLAAEQWPLTEFDAVLLRTGNDSSSSDGPAQYEVALRGRAGRGHAVISHTAAYEIARARAVTVAQTLGFPLIEASGSAGPPVPPLHADSPLRDLPPSVIGPVPEAPRPANARSRVRPKGNGLQIRIPSPAFRASKLLHLLVPVFFLVYLLPAIRQFLDETQTPAVVQYVILGFAALFLVVAPVMKIVNGMRRASRGGSVLEVSSSGVLLEERGAWTRQHIEIPTQEIIAIAAGTVDQQIQAALELHHEKEGLAPRASSPRGPGSSPVWLRAVQRLAVSEGLILTTRSRRLFFGAGLSDDELRYLKAEVLQVLRSSD